MKFNKSYLGTLSILFLVLGSVSFADTSRTSPTSPSSDIIVVPEGRATHIFIKTDKDNHKNDSINIDRVVNQKFYYIVIPKQSSSKNAGKRIPSNDATDVDLRIVRNASDDDMSVINATWEFARRNKSDEVILGSYNQYFPINMLNGLYATTLLKNIDSELVLDQLNSSVMESNTATYSEYTSQSNLNLRIRAAYFLAGIGKLKKIHADENDDISTANVINELLLAKDIYAIAAIAAREEKIPSPDAELAKMRLKEELGRKK